jgi:hypothetical protein
MRTSNHTKHIQQQHAQLRMHELNRQQLLNFTPLPASARDCTACNFAWFKPVLHANRGNHSSSCETNTPQSGSIPDGNFPTHLGPARAMLLHISRATNYANIPTRPMTKHVFIVKLHASGVTAPDISSHDSITLHFK